MSTASRCRIGYSSHAGLAREIDQLLVDLNPDTPEHKMGEGVLKAVALAGETRLAALKARLSSLPPALARTMVGRPGHTDAVESDHADHPP